MGKYTRKKNRKNFSKSSQKKGKRKNKKQKGGFLKNLTTDIVMLWQNPHQITTPNDCCPCVFSLLGMPPAAVHYLRMNNLNGFSKEKIEEGFSVGYPEYYFSFHKSDNLSDKSPEMVIAYLESIWTTIPENFSTVGGIERNDGTKHCIVFAKDNNNVKIILDAQIGQAFQGIESIYQYLASQGVIFIYVLKSQKKSANPTDHQPLVLNTTGRKIFSKSEEKQEVDALSSMLQGLKVDAAAEPANDESQDMDVD